MIGARGVRHVIGVGITVEYKLLRSRCQFNRARVDAKLVVAVNGIVVFIHATYFNGQRTVVNVRDRRHCRAPVGGSGLVLNRHCCAVGDRTGGYRTQCSAIIHLHRIRSSRAEDLHASSTGDGLSSDHRHVVVLNTHRRGESRVNHTGGARRSIDTHVRAGCLHHTGGEGVARSQFVGRQHRRGSIEAGPQRGLVILFRVIDGDEKVFLCNAQSTESGMDTVGHILVLVVNRVSESIVVGSIITKVCNACGRRSDTHGVTRRQTEFLAGSVGCHRHTAVGHCIGGILVQKSVESPLVVNRRDGDCNRVGRYAERTVNVCNGVVGRNVIIGDISFDDSR